MITECDGETFVSADDLRINLWNLEISNQSFNIVDVKPANMEDLTEVITSAEFHPAHCNTLAYSSSKGSIRLIDLRQAPPYPMGVGLSLFSTCQLMPPNPHPSYPVALCDRHAKLMDFLKRDTALATTAVYRSMFAAEDGSIPATFQNTIHFIMHNNLKHQLIQHTYVSVCFAMTINKSQGQSLSRVGLFLKDPVFTHGQLYVALSRVKSRDGVKLLILDEDGRVTNKTTNVVYKEVFRDL
ncbi:putative transcription factor WD40-like family [Helianthus annuus]|nr:putative transcription factor WD40-like family [Helianthus annuus]